MTTKNSPAPTRNFSIIAHIDHGKSTLADRILELTNTIPEREMRERYLDQMDLEQERGVTIKLQPIRIFYSPDSSQVYTLNLIDTPGHVDFSYEVSRSLAACEGAVLLVDKAQGIQAQTLAHYQKARRLGLTIIPVVNKIDLPLEDIATEQLVKQLHFSAEEIIRTSAVTGAGVPELLRAIIKRVPPPRNGSRAPLRALIFDSYYEPHFGVIALVRITEGQIRPEEGRLPEMNLLATDTSFTPKEVGYLQGRRIPQDQLSTGDVGYIATGIKDIDRCQVGDTITLARNLTGDRPFVKPLPGYQKIKPRVFTGIYPQEANQFADLQDAITKLSLNDSALTFNQESSPLLGRGFRGGFLGHFHLEIIRERLQREFDISTIVTAPSVEYQVEIEKESGETSLLEVKSAESFPAPHKIRRVLEPWVTIDIFTPYEYLGNVMELTQNRRAELQNTQETREGNRLILSYHMPLNELMDNFHGDLKSVSSGFASFEYELIEHRPGDIIKLNILINKEIIEPLSLILPRYKARQKGQELVRRLKEIVPPQQFAIPIQAAIGNEIVARTDLRALRKDVTAKLYGGDRTRKDKLLRQQKEGKKRLKTYGQVNLSPEVFHALHEK